MNTNKTVPSFPAQIGFWVLLTLLFLGAKAYGDPTATGVGMLLFMYTGVLAGTLIRRVFGSS